MMLFSSPYEYRSNQCFKVSLLLIVVVVFLWTQAISHFTHLYENAADVRKTSSSNSHYEYEYENDKDDDDFCGFQDGNSSDSVAEETMVTSRNNRSQITPLVIWLMSFPNSVCSTENKKTNTI